MINPYAAGKKVYNGGSSAATSGTVDPMGYINRSLNSNNATGPSGALGSQPSQTRSGLAQSALQRLRASGTSQRSVPGGALQATQPVPPKPGIVQPTAPPVANTNAPGTAAPAPTAPSPADPVAQATQTPAPVGTTPAGQVFLNLPFDYDLADQRTQGTSAYNNLLVMLQNAANTLQQNNFAQTRDVGYAQEDDQRGDLNRFAGRGMAYSSGYGNEVGNSTRDFEAMRQDLANSLTQGQNDLEGQRSYGAQSFNDLLSSLARIQAERSAAKAGDLHLNDPPPIKPPPVVNPNPAKPPPVKTPPPKGPPSKLPPGSPGGATGAFKPTPPPTKKPPPKKKPAPKPKSSIGGAAGGKF